MNKQNKLFVFESSSAGKLITKGMIDISGQPNLAAGGGKTRYKSGKEKSSFGFLMINVCTCLEKRKIRKKKTRQNLFGITAFFLFKVS